VEIPIDIIYRVRVNETLYYSYMDYVENVGSFISFLFYILQGITCLISINFIVKFTNELKKLVKRKYTETNLLHQMKYLLTKFRKIHAALEEQRDKPEYFQIFKEIESFLDVNFETISSIEIKK